MKFVQPTRDDVLNCCTRAAREAEHGRVGLALQRLRDVSTGQAAYLLPSYCEGLIRWDYLGSGIEAGRLFREAHEAPADRFDDQQTRRFAACNAASLAPAADEYRRWARIAAIDAPKAERDFHARTVARLDGGVPYSDLLREYVAACLERDDRGKAAAYLELALALGGWEQRVELELRVGRADCLRALDKRGASRRQTLAEDFPPDERLTLIEALAEVERAIALDEYDPELWNRRSAWSTLLRRSEEALRSAERAIELRPTAYAKPWINKVVALSDLGALQDAHAALREAERSAKQAEDSLDLAQIAQLKEQLSSPTVSRLIDLESFFAASARAAVAAADEELAARGGLDQLSAGVSKHLRRAEDSPGALVPLTASLLWDFTPRTVSAVLRSIAMREPALATPCVRATAFITCHTSGAQQMDAARCLSLMILSAESASAVEQNYRRMVIEPSAVGSGDWTRLNRIAREDLIRINPYLKGNLPCDTSVDEVGRIRGEKMVAEFAGEIGEIQWRAKPGFNDLGQAEDRSAGSWASPTPFPPFLDLPRTDEGFQRLAGPSAALCLVVSIASCGRGVYLGSWKLGALGFVFLVVALLCALRGKRSGEFP